MASSWIFQKVCFGFRCLDDGTGVGGDTGPEVGTLLGDGTGDGGTLHLTLGVDNDTGAKRG